MAFRPLATNRSDQFELRQSAGHRVLPAVEVEDKIRLRLGAIAVRMKTATVLSE